MRSQTKISRVLQGTESLSQDKKVVIARLLKDKRWRLDRRNPPISATYLETIAEDGEPPRLLSHKDWSNPKQANYDVYPRYIPLPPITNEENNELASEGLHLRQHLNFGRIQALGGYPGPSYTKLDVFEASLRDMIEDDSSSEASEEEWQTSRSSSRSSSIIITSPLTPHKLKHPYHLLELLPDSAEKPLACNLIKTNSIAAHRYIVLQDGGTTGVRSRALWDRTTGQRLAITKDVYLALKAIRRTISVALTLWIDSVCASPKRLLEYSHLVAKLENIYCNAQGVVQQDKKRIIICVPQSHPLQISPKIQHGFADVKEITQSAMEELMIRLAKTSRQRMFGKLNTAPYKYSALKYIDSIRVLEIMPGPRNAPLVCKLVETRLGETKYQALSYAWGSPIMSKRIHEHSSGTTLHITRNLYQALQVLRRHHSTLTLWVDAICIDQNSILERNHQVQQMANLYCQAEAVIVWLGRKECRKLMTTLARLGTLQEGLVSGRLPSTIFDDRRENGIEERGDLQLAFVNREVQAWVKDCDLAELGEFLERSWFRRVWVLQEWLLAREVTIYAGDDCISFDLFGYAIDTLQHHEHLIFRPSSAHIKGLMSRYLRNINVVADMVNSRRLYPWKIKRSLYQCCRMLIDRECTNDHDKIYAVLGLAMDSLSIQPDYEQSLEEVRLELSTKSLLAGDFSILHHADISQQPSFLAQLRSCDGQARPLPLGGNNTDRYRAGLSRKGLVRGMQQICVAISGVWVDEVCFLDDFTAAMIAISTGHGTPLKSELFVAYEHVKTYWLSLATNRSKDATSFKLAFWRTMNLGFYPKQERIPYYEKGLDFRFLDLPYRQNMQTCFKNRAFFMTKSGYIGLGPRWMKEQDQVVIFDGAETPFLLRGVTVNETEAWKLVGDCYLDGWMDGGYNGHQFEPAVGSAGVDRTQRYDAPHQEAGEGMRTLKSESFFVT
ncbi:hypothetical protein HBI82_109820 [Parastagonospora nodorum]|nr:hypothetical protein HBI82_109820 [Parastagonospora nodorum]KAH6216245.1 hypothetical protein HBI43_128220 [Parastagonospora nodorum]KAH6254953.1 hypothetical protein HBI42_128760 [Parastagonospora nodorum]KAH6413757.1 hypothetical protein HBI14_131160 [Parastagonospora nodorum]